MLSNLRIKREDPCSESDIRMFFFLSSPPPCTPTPIIVVQMSVIPFGSCPVVPSSMVSLFVFPIQMRQGRGRLGEEDSDVDIEGFDDDDDGKPKTPAPVSIFTKIPATGYALTCIIVVEVSITVFIAIVRLLNVVLKC